MLRNYIHTYYCSSVYTYILTCISCTSTICILKFPVIPNSCPTTYTKVVQRHARNEGREYYEHNNSSSTPFNAVDFASPAPGIYVMLVICWLRLAAYFVSDVSRNS